MCTIAASGKNAINRPSNCVRSSCRATHLRKNLASASH
jgi:hypothetical protein